MFMVKMIVYGRVLRKKYSSFCFEFTSKHSVDICRSRFYFQKTLCSCSNFEFMPETSVYDIFDSFARHQKFSNPSFSHVFCGCCQLVGWKRRVMRLVLAFFHTLLLYGNAQELRSTLWRNGFPKARRISLPRARESSLRSTAAASKYKINFFQMKQYAMHSEEEKSEILNNIENMEHLKDGFGTFQGQFNQNYQKNWPRLLWPKHLFELYKTELIWNWKVSLHRRKSLVNSAVQLLWGLATTKAFAGSRTKVWFVKTLTDPNNILPIV